MIVGNEPDVNVKLSFTRTLSEIVTAPLARAVGRSMLTEVVIFSDLPGVLESVRYLPEITVLPFFNAIVFSPFPSAVILPRMSL